jgi:hypothetical protein
MFRDLYRSRPHLGMIYVAMKSLRRLQAAVVEAAARSGRRLQGN